MDSKANLVARINRSGDVNDPATPRPLVSLEEFFEGNDDPGSIGCNLPGEVEPGEFYELFRRIRDHDEVSDVRVEINMHDDPEAWPFSDTVWVITSTSAETVATWIPERLEPDELFSGFHEDRPMETYEVPDGMTAAAVVWVFAEDGECGLKLIGEDAWMLLPERAGEPVEAPGRPDGKRGRHARGRVLPRRGAGFARRSASRNSARSSPAGRLLPAR